MKMIMQIFCYNFELIMKESIKGVQPTETITPKEQEQLLHSETDPKGFGEKKHRGKHRQKGNSNWSEPGSLPIHFPLIVRKNDRRFVNQSPPAKNNRAEDSS